MTIPAEAARRLGIREWDRVVVEAEDDEIIVRPARSLAELVEGWKPLGPPELSRQMTDVIRKERDERSASR